MIKAVLFDLDGTLLPMNQDEFIKNYFGLLAKILSTKGYNPKTLINSIKLGTSSMIANDGEQTNEEVFWKEFNKVFNELDYNNNVHFEEFYNNYFDQIKVCCGFDPNANNVIKKIKSMGYKIVVATNPLFPKIAIEKRMLWAGLNIKDFEFYTTYENSNYSKPNPKYYLQIAKKLNVKPNECVMVGNDVSEDMIAASVGMKVFLVTDNLINIEQKNIDIYHKGSLINFLTFLENN